MKSVGMLSAALALLLVTPASADVVSATTTTMEIHDAITIDAPIQQVWDTLRSPQRWWSKDHTYSDDSANLYLDTQATGCFCERFPDRKGSVEHARILYIQPPRMIRLSGALGPLQAEAVVGTLTFKLDPEGSNATKLTLDYVVSGYVRAGADTLAPKVDEVLALQVVNLKSAAEAPPPPAPPPTR
ncbi:MAG: ATPase [Sphingomonas bacterium]|uniref:SRPBCC family protein n=1 Tax=Sphingomonas bacterium TaxID=1895847 RepID=UPI00261B4DF0|nr:SRPBCC family protein [Sphingomonas bacterium]MDB5704279.1 ATPase [Sphingomonas bacterium]